MIVWGKPDERLIQYGCDRGVLYVDGKGIPWNGLVGIDESSDSSVSIHYLDGQIFFAEIEPGDFTGTLSAFYYPDEFSAVMGVPEVADGLYLDNQKPQKFGLSYRNIVGTGGKGDKFGHQIHLVTNAIAKVGTVSRKTVGDTIELEPMSWDIVATPSPATNHRPTAHYIIDTRNLLPETVAELEDILYGDNPRIPTSVELYDMLTFGGALLVLQDDSGHFVRGSYKRFVRHEETGEVDILDINAVDHGDGTITISDTIV